METTKEKIAQFSRIKVLTTKVKTLESELETLRSVIRSLDCNVFWTDLEGRYQGSNLDKKGFDIVGKTVEDFMSPADAKTIRAVDKKCYAGEVVNVIERADSFDKHGNSGTQHFNRKSYLSSKSPLINNQHEIIGMVGVAIEISDFVRQIKTLSKKIKQNKKIEKKHAVALAAQRATVFELFHDLLSPYQGMIYELESISKKTGQTTLQDVTKTIYCMVDNINAALSYLNDNNCQQNNQNMEIKLILKDILSTFKLRSKHKGLKIYYKIDSKCPKVIHINGFSLRKILENLINNAIKYTDEGYVKITIRNKQQLLICHIMDTGIGIAPEHHQLIFKEFAQIGTSNPAKTGIGLGLASVRKLLKHLNGTINVKSAPGQGTTMTIQVPFENAHPTPKVVLPDPPVPPTSIATPQQQLSILLIDDDAITVQAIKAQFKEFNLKIECENNYEKAKKRIEKNIYHILITDLNIGADKGYDLIELMNKKNIPYYSVLMTSDRNPAIKNVMNKHHINHLVIKPFGTTTVSQIIDAALHEAEQI